MKTRLGEHDFFLINNRIYRVFGYEHPHGKYYGLLRYWRESQSNHWVKPLVNGAERGIKDVLNLYNCNRVISEPYGLELGLFRVEDIEKVFSSINHSCIKYPFVEKILSMVRNYIDSYCHINQCAIQVGLIGSHLVGIATPSSDIDIVFYGIANAKEACSFIKPLFNIISDRDNRVYTGDTKKSASDTRAFIQKSGLSNLSTTDRALFGTYCFGKKVDIYYVRNADTQQISNPISVKSTSPPSVFIGKIVNSDNRIYYPPSLTVEINGQNKEVIFSNHEAKFLIEGDCVKFRAIEKKILKSGSKNWKQGNRVLLSTELINCYPIC